MKRPLILAACMMATFMAAVESTIVATSMPSIAATLGGFGLYSWVFSAYMLTQALGIPIYGRLADMYGRKKVFYAGAGLFLVGSVLCGLAGSMVQLVIFRAVQGLGAGGVQPIAFTIVGDIYAPAERARIQGLISSVFGVAAIIGPSLGAFLVHYGNWPLVFWVNLPIGAAAITMIALCLREQHQTRSHRVDYAGSVLLAVAIAALMLVLVQGPGLHRIVVVSLVFTCVVALIVLAWHELRIAEPMLPLELWRNRIIVIGSVASCITGALMMGIIAFLPAYVQGAMGRGATVVGFILGLMTVIWALASAVAGLLLPRTSYRLIAILGTLALIGGCGMLIFLTPGRGAVWAGAGALLVGVGMGFCNTTFIVSVQTSVPYQKRGAATGSCLFLRFLGQALGAAAFGAVLNASLLARSGAVDQLMDPVWRGSVAPEDLARLTDLVARAMHNTYLLAGALAVASFAFAMALPAGLGPVRQAVGSRR